MGVFFQKDIKVFEGYFYANLGGFMHFRGGFQGGSHMALSGGGSLVAHGSRMVFLWLMALLGWPTCGSLMALIWLHQKSPLGVFSSHLFPYGGGAVLNPFSLLLNIFLIPLKRLIF